MRVAFHSSHVTGDFSSGRLVVQVTVEDDARELTRQGEIFFSVPPDYHVHNDLVAAALMAIMGWEFREARFNFPISERCAGLLPGYHRLEEVSPVDPSLEPRRPGRFLGICLSGGLDSVGVYTMLRDVVGIDFKIITGEYDGYHREAVGYASYKRDVSCWTNFRRVWRDRGRRFDAALPLLFADYADLHSFASGHTFATLPLMWNDPSSTDPPEFLEQDAVAAAGGLTEVHIVRCLNALGILKLLVSVAPERIEHAFFVTGKPGEGKYINKALMLRHAYRELDQPIPAFLEDLSWPQYSAAQKATQSIHNWTVWQWKHLDLATAIRASPRIERQDWAPLKNLRLDYHGKYIPALARLIPAEFQATLTAGFEAAGIAPFDQQDYAELEQVRQFILAVNQPHPLWYQ